LEARDTRRQLPSQVGQVVTETPQTDVSVITDAQTTASTRRGGNAGDQFGPAGRSVGMMQSSLRRAIRGPSASLSSGFESSHNIARVASSQRIQTNITYIDLDSHADTACIGRNCRVLAYSSMEVDVKPYHRQYKSITGIPVVQAATAYDDPETGETYILVINQGLYFGDTLEHTLLNPNQMRTNGIIVDDVPKHLAPNPSEAMHSIFIPENDLRINMEMRGVISCWPGRKPSDREVETCTWIHLTPEAEWDPHSNEFAENERLASERDNGAEYYINSIHTEKHDCSPLLSGMPASLLPSSRLISQMWQSVSVQMLTSSTRHSKVRKEELARLWNILG
jgi:hypothetical protein